ncbi:HEPN domain-containing protein [bacterium]|nr:HEPN domain-containing protein [bacterium]
MVNTDKQITYWYDGALEDIEVAQQLVNTNRTRHGLFFAHLALEKMLKACVCKETQDLAPRIHNLRRLAELANLELNSEQKNIMTEANTFNLEGRYPEFLGPPPKKNESIKLLNNIKELFEWLKSQS